jgi:hypothetical protein
MTGKTGPAGGEGQFVTPPRPKIIVLMTACGERRAEVPAMQAV